MKLVYALVTIGEYKEGEAYLVSNSNAEVLVSLKRATYTKPKTKKVNNKK